MYEVGVSEDSTVPKLWSAIKNLTKQVVIMKLEMNEFKSVNRKGSYCQCDSCKINNDKCNYCYKCRQLGHSGKCCNRSNQESTGNGNRLLVLGA